MRRGVCLALLGSIIWAGMAVTSGEAQVYPVRWDDSAADPQRAAPAPPSLVLAEGGVEFPDGSVQASSAAAADPPCFSLTHRFVDCGNGTVTDSATSLIWLEQADCFGEQDWLTATQSAAGLANGACGLTDGSRVGDWRLPTKEEWQSILKSACETDPEIVGNGSPILGCFGDPGGVNEWASGVLASVYYWASTMHTTNPLFAWSADFGRGGVGTGRKTDSGYFVWPVRDP